ncbi:MAG: hypothetical protein MJZ52_07020 [Bacteroidales bacterium]|nr:hypothetical protein [Bacteroidales bacterium]
MFIKGDKGHLKHGLRKTRLYRIWSNIKTRCHNQNDKHFSQWGARGVTMCEEWKNDFKSFYDWAMSNGYSDDLTIDRIDNNGNYEPSNCRWTSYKEQNQNKRNVIILEYDGKSMSATAWAKELNIGHDTIRQRFHKGWTVEECLFGKKGR